MLIDLGGGTREADGGAYWGPLPRSGKRPFLSFVVLRRWLKNTETTPGFHGPWWRKTTTSTTMNILPYYRQPCCLQWPQDVLSVPDQRLKGHLTTDNAHYCSGRLAATAAWEPPPWPGPGHSSPTADPPANHTLHSLLPPTHTHPPTHTSTSWW